MNNALFIKIILLSAITACHSHADSTDPPVLNDKDEQYRPEIKKDPSTHDKRYTDTSSQVSTGSDPVPPKGAPSKKIAIPKEVYPYIKDRVSPQQEEFLTCLKKHGSEDSQQIVNEMQKRLPSLLKLLNYPNTNGTETIAKHSINVMNNFIQQSKFYFEQPSDLETEFLHFGIQNAITLIKSTCILHDIGKGIALEKTGNPYEQHLYTNPILIHALGQLGFNDNDIKFASSLTKQDPLGEFIQGKRNVKETKQSIVSLASSSGVSLSLFYRIIKIFYIADACSYPYIMGESFDQEASGKIIPNHNKIQMWNALDTWVDTQFEAVVIDF